MEGLPDNGSITRDARKEQVRLTPDIGQHSPYDLRRRRLTVVSLGFRPPTRRNFGLVWVDPDYFLLRGECYVDC